MHSHWRPTENQLPWNSFTVRFMFHSIEEVYVYQFLWARPVQKRITGRIVRGSVNARGLRQKDRVWPTKNDPRPTYWTLFYTFSSGSRTGDETWWTVIREIWRTEITHRPISWKFHTHSILTIFHNTILNSFIGLTLVKWQIHGWTTSLEILTMTEKNPDEVWKELPMEHLSRWDLNSCTESTLALNSSWWLMSNSPTIDRIRSIKLWKLTHKDFRPAHVASGPLVLALWGQSEVLIVANDQPISASLRKTRGLNNPNIRE